MKSIKKIMGMIFLIMDIASYGYVNIYPLSFDKTIDKNGSSETYKLYNATNRSVKYKIYIDISEKEKDMSEWIEYYPKTITLPPGKEGEIKILIKAPKNIASGEYSAILGIKELPVLIREEDLLKKNSGVRILTDLRLHISGFTEDTFPELKISNIKMIQDKKNIKFDGKIKNIGERRGKFYFYLTDKKEKESYLLGEHRILKGKEFDLSILNLNDMKNETIKYLSKKNILLIKEVESGEVIQRVNLN